MKSIYDLDFRDLHIEDELEKYRVEISMEDTVGTIIYKHLSGKPGFIRHKRSYELAGEEQKVYLDAIHKVVSKGAPLELFFSAFSPKVRNPHTTNNMVYPGMADLLTMIHLHMVAKGIREVYSYGFRFIIAYNGNTYRDFAGWKQSDVDRTFEILNEYVRVAEKLTGVRNVVQLTDRKKLVDHEGDYMAENIRREQMRIRLLYEENDPEQVRKIDAWMKDFRKTLNVSEFSSIDDLDAFMFDNAIYYRALKNVELNGGEHDLGICNSFPNVLAATIRGLGAGVSFQLNPFFRFHSHQRLIVLSEKENWKMMKWSEMNELNATYEPVYVKELDYPFFHREI